MAQSREASSLLVTVTARSRQVTRAGVQPPKRLTAGGFHLAQTDRHDLRFWRAAGNYYLASVEFHLLTGFEGNEFPARCEELTLLCNQFHFAKCEAKNRDLAVLTEETRGCDLQAQFMMFVSSRFR